MFLTTGNNFNNHPAKRKILIAPLEWGLGHATRCIPLVKALLAQNCEVLIAAGGATKLLLREEFPNLFFLPLMGYGMKYNRKKISLMWKLLSQFPKIIFIIYREHAWLNRAINKYKIDAVISDNRFGLYSKKVPCVYITHQLLIKTGNRFTEKIAQQMHYWFIKKYKECWVPDFDINGLGGELSHPVKFPENVKYIGALSRFEKTDAAEKKFDLLITISGPEPQRTIFEKQLLNDIKFYNGKVLFVRGLPDGIKNSEYKNDLAKMVNHLSAKDLNDAILRSEMVISRCGYTTVMDLIKIGKKAILIPTPGQTEQEYLAKYLMDQKIFYTVAQNNFSLMKVLQGASDFSFKMPLYNMEQYKNVVDQFVQSL